MSKWLVLGLVLVAAFWWITRQRDRLRGQGERQSSSTPPESTRPSAPAPQIMVACCRCGVYLPRADAVLDADSGQAYCGPEHRKAGPAP